MAAYVISPVAELDIDSILDWTEERFGVPCRLRYEELIIQAIMDVADNPHRVGSQSRHELIASARTYHLNHSRHRVTTAISKVRHPRHFLLYRCLDDGRIEISRILHECMDLVQHLPTEYQSDIVGEE